VAQPVIRHVCNIYRLHKEGIDQGAGMVRRAAEPHSA